MKKILLAAIIVMLVSLPLSATVPVSAQSQKKALILSSLEKYVPMGYYGIDLRNSLTSSGYNVTFINDTAVTIDLLTTQLNNYDIVIWRTNAYMWAHTTYWYVGELGYNTTMKAHADDFAAGWIDNHNGIVGASIDFFVHHFPQGSLGNVKLMVLTSSMSLSVADVMIKAGVRSTVGFDDVISLAFGDIDYVINAVFEFLAGGGTVKASVDTVVNFLNRVSDDPTDTRYVPRIGYLGDNTLTIV